jgi:hypothetical protein
MWIDFKERRDETNKEWMVIGQRRIVWELGRMGKERVCGEERWDVGIQEEDEDEDEEVDFDKDTGTPFNTPPESPSDTRSESHRRFTYDSWH